MQRLTHQTSGNLLSRVLGLAGAVLLVGVSLFLGLFLLAILLGLAVIGMAVFMGRVWWLQRKLRRAARREGPGDDSSVLEGEYVIIKRTSRTEQREEKQ